MRVGMGGDGWTMGGRWAFFSSNGFGWRWADDGLFPLLTGLADDGWTMGFFSSNGFGFRWVDDGLFLF